HLVEDEEDGGAGHVAVLGEDVAGGAHAGLVEGDLLLNLVEDGRTARVHHPEDGVPVVDAERHEGVGERALDTVGYELRDVLGQVEGETHLAEVPHDGVLRARQDGLARRHNLEQRPLIGCLVGVRADDHRRCAVAEERVPDEGVEVRLGRPPEGHRHDLRAHHQHPRAAVVLGQVLGHAQHRATGEAPLLVHHQPLHRRG
ncbi:Os07g0215050, partial [Oryza sativa Japonica Group]